MLKSKPLCWFVRQFGMRTHGNEAPACMDDQRHIYLPDTARAAKFEIVMGSVFVTVYSVDTKISYREKK